MEVEEDQPDAEVEAHHDVDQPDDEETDQARPGLPQCSSLASFVIDKIC